MSETALRSAIVEALNTTALVRVWSVHAGRVRVRGGWMHLSPVGTPDIVGYVLASGRFVGVEVKVRGNKTDKARAEAQRAAQAAMSAAGGVAGQVESIVEALALLRAALTEAA